MTGEVGRPRSDRHGCLWGSRAANDPVRDLRGHWLGLAGVASAIRFAERFCGAGLRRLEHERDRAHSGRRVVDFALFLDRPVGPSQASLCYGEYRVRLSPVDASSASARELCVSAMSR